MSIQFLQQLAQSTDKEIVAIAREEGFDITTSEVKKTSALFGAILIFPGFFLGIPKDILVEVEAVLGRKRSRQLIALFTK
ncbi:Nif11 family protein [Lysinibacillus sp. MHQ-1]|nr:Nif11 family protein [Lysinibacillus sp. MHQ-1]